VNAPLVGIVMGSDSDLPTMRPAAEALAGLGVAHEVGVVSAHRTPHAMLEYAGAAQGRGLQVLIAGAGPIGVMAAGVVKHAGARYVVVTDVNDYRLDLARQMGATVALNVKSGRTLKDVQQQLGMKEGFDVGLEMSGNPAALRQMIDNMCHGGKIAMLGIQSEQVPFDWSKVVFNMLTIKGVYGREMYETWYKMTVMLETGLNIKPAITHRFHYSEFEKGFEVMMTGKSGKVILNWR